MVTQQVSGARIQSHNFIHQYVHPFQFLSPILFLNSFHPEARLSRQLSLAKYLQFAEESFVLDTRLNILPFKHFDKYQKNE